MPYRCSPDIGSANANFYYEPGVSVPASFVVGKTLVISAWTDLSGVAVFNGIVADVVRTAILNEDSGTYGTAVTLYAVDRIAQFNQIPVPGIITAATIRNVTWESRLTDKLQPYFPASSAVFPSTGTEAHVYRLVDNNVDGTLVDQINLACNSVGATWKINANSNQAEFNAKGVYNKTGCLFTDDATYWNAGNKPANAGTINAYNLTYKTLEMSFDSRDLVNEVTVTNIMPRNMITRASDGALLWKDPPTTKVDALEVINPTYTASNAASITSYGRRPGDLVTNLYPYRTTDSDSWYIRYNASLDPYCEYRNPAVLTSPQANTTFTNTNVYSGTYSALVTLNATTNSFPIYASEPLPIYPYARTGTINAWRIRMRAPNATTTVYIQAEFQDSYGNILSTYSPASPVTLAANTWTQLALALPAASIPAGAVQWRPRLSMNITTGSWAAGTAWRFDEIEINPQIDLAQMFSGDDADTSGALYGWETYAGDSQSYRIRNILDNVGSDALTYLKDGGLAPRYLEWNVRQDWNVAYRFNPGNRIDIRFNGANYIAWIDSVEWEITPDDAIIKMNLSRRPSSWN